jgi:hypothetical protein
MIPIPNSAVSLKDIGSEDPAYRNLLNLELRYINQNATAIFTRARYVYQSVVQKKDPAMVKNCCDFKALEAACAEYERITKQQTQTEAQGETAIIKTADGKTSVNETIRASREKKSKRQLSEPPQKSKQKSDPER